MHERGQIDPMSSTHLIFALVSNSFVYISHDTEDVNKLNEIYRNNLYFMRVFICDRHSSTGTHLMHERSQIDPSFTVQYTHYVMTCTGILIHVDKDIMTGRATG